MALKLIIGNKNYSSWSLRPWIAMRALGIAFEEVLVPFGTPIGDPDFKARLAPYTPAGKVPWPQSEFIWCRTPEEDPNSAAQF